MLTETSFPQVKVREDRCIFWRTQTYDWAVKKLNLPFRVSIACNEIRKTFQTIVLLLGYDKFEDYFGFRFVPDSENL